MSDFKLDETANNFLNDCILALQTIKGEFEMDGYTTAVEPDPSGRGFCGTPACVLGHYATMVLAVKSLRKRGKVILSDADDTRVLELAQYIHIGERKDITGNLKQEHLEELFDGSPLSVGDNDYEWGCGGAKTAKHAIKYLKKFILQHGGHLREYAPVAEVQVAAKPVKVLQPVEV